MVAVVLIVLVLVLIGVALVLLYNSLIRLRNACNNSWALIDVQLKRRSDLIPNLVATVKGYAAHERTTLEAVIQARRQVDSAQNIRDQEASEGMLTQALGRLFALQEAYPNLKADKNFLSLQGQLATTENTIAYARQAYNDAATRFNNAIQTFPGVLLAGKGNFERRDLFAAPASALEVPQVDFTTSPLSP